MQWDKIGLIQFQKPRWVPWWVAKSERLCGDRAATGKAALIYHAPGAACTALEFCRAHVINWVEVNQRQTPTAGYTARCHQLVHVPGRYI